MVSRVGLGLAALGRPGYVNLGHGDDLAGGREPAALAARTATVLDVAHEAGVRYLDVARSYGAAEGFLGAWLRARPTAAAQVVVGSKWGYTYTAGWEVDADVHEVKDHGALTLERQWAETHRSLGRRPALYQIHSVTPDSGVLADPVVLRRLARIRRGGTAVGLTTSGPEQAAVVRAAVGVEVDGEPLFDVVQATWNLLEPSAGPALAAAHDAGVGVIVKEALANGRLAGRDASVSAALHHARHRPDALALAAALAQPWADVVLSGATTVEQLRSNLEALEVAGGDVPVVQAEPAAAYWEHRRSLPWT